MTREGKDPRKSGQEGVIDEDDDHDDDSVSHSH